MHYPGQQMWIPERWKDRENNILNTLNFKIINMEIRVGIFFAEFAEFIQQRLKWRVRQIKARLLDDADDDGASFKPGLYNLKVCRLRKWNDSNDLTLIAMRDNNFAILISFNLMRRDANPASFQTPRNRNTPYDRIQGRAAPTPSAAKWKI